MWFVAAAYYVVLFKRLRKLETQKLQKLNPEATTVSVIKSIKLRRVVMCCLCAMTGGANSVTGFGFKYGVPLGQFLGTVSLQCISESYIRLKVKIVRSLCDIYICTPVHIYTR